LTDEEGGTKLAYEVNAQIGGKMAQLGARLIDSTAKQMAESFFSKFSAVVAPPAASPAAVGLAPSPYHGLAEDHDHDPSNPHYFGLPIGVIIAAGVAVIAVAIVVFKFL